MQNKLLGNRQLSIITHTRPFYPPPPSHTYTHVLCSRSGMKTTKHSKVYILHKLEFSNSRCCPQNKAPSESVLKISLEVILSLKGSTEVVRLSKALRMKLKWSGEHVLGRRTCRRGALINNRTIIWPEDLRHGHGVIQITWMCSCRQDFDKVLQIEVRNCFQMSGTGRAVGLYVRL